MKKFFLFAASALMLASFASCNPEDKPKPEDEKPEVQTAKENLVVYMPLESAEKAVEVGEGITFASKEGSASFGAGRTGNGYVNTSGKNDKSYLKFNLAQNNALSKLTDVTLTVWVNNIEDYQKGGLFSVNGKLFPTQDWPSCVVMFDNKGIQKDENGNETGVKDQQINGRFMYKLADGNETNLWLDTWNPAFAKYASWFQIAFTYEAAIGAWSLYVDGVKVKDAEYGDKPAFGKCIPSDANAFYIGGWASFIESWAGAAEWQSYFAGSIDELRIYNRVLTEAEIGELRKEELKIALS
jgi:hypothetical protein